jgi:hypothetical protein
MSETILTYFFTLIWPGAIASVITAVVAVLRRSYIWMIVSTLCLAPFLFYLGMTPRFWYAPYFLLLHTFSCLHMRRGNPKVAIFALIPSLALLVFVASLVVTQ